MRRRAFLSLVFLALAAGSTSASAQKRGDRNTITRLDLDEAGGSVITALDAVQRLRSHWLRPALGKQATAGVTGELGAQNPGVPVVYIDDRREPNMEQLRTVQAERILEMKYLDQNRAVQMLGPGHESGAILVKTAGRR